MYDVYKRPPLENPQEVMEFNLEVQDRLTGFEGHENEEFVQLRCNDWHQRRQWKGMKLLLRSFARAFEGTENGWRATQGAVRTIWLQAIDVKNALLPDGNIINEVARLRRSLYEKLDAFTRSRGERGRLLDQLFDWRVEGTIELVQLLADAYDIEILVHIPHRQDDGTVKWRVLSRGTSSDPAYPIDADKRGQIHLINYSSLNRWTAAMQVKDFESQEAGKQTNDFKYSAHMAIDPRHYYHRRPVLYDPLLPRPLPRIAGTRDAANRDPNYILDPNSPTRPVPMIPDAPTADVDLFVTGGTQRLTTPEDFALIQRVRREAREQETRARGYALDNQDGNTPPSTSSPPAPSSSSLSAPDNSGSSIASSSQPSSAADKKKLMDNVVRTEKALRNQQYLTGLGFHPEIRFRQHHVRGDGSCLIHAFARAYFNDEQQSPRVRNDIQRMVVRAGMWDNGTAFGHGVDVDQTVANARGGDYYQLQRRSLQEKRGTLAEMARGDRYGTDALVQILADVYGVEVFTHTPVANHRTMAVYWELTVRGDQTPSRDHQVHLVNYRNMCAGGHWDALEPCNGARYTNHSTEEDQILMRGILDTMPDMPLFIPQPIPRGNRRGRGPNYRITTGTVNDDAESDNDFNYPSSCDCASASGGTSRRSPAKDLTNKKHNRPDGSDDEAKRRPWKKVKKTAQLPPQTSSPRPPPSNESSNHPDPALPSSPPASPNPTPPTLPKRPRPTRVNSDPGPGTGLGSPPRKRFRLDNVPDYVPRRPPPLVESQEIAETQQQETSFYRFSSSPEALFEGSMAPPSSPVRLGGARVVRMVPPRTPPEQTYLFLPPSSSAAARREARRRGSSNSGSEGHIDLSKVIPETQDEYADSAGTLSSEVPQTQQPEGTDAAESPSSAMRKRLRRSIDLANVLRETQFVYTDSAGNSGSGGSSEAIKEVVAETPPRYSDEVGGSSVLQPGGSAADGSSSAETVIAGGIEAIVQVGTSQPRHHSDLASDSASHQRIRRPSHVPRPPAPSTQIPSTPPSSALLSPFAPPPRRRRSSTAVPEPPNGRVAPPATPVGPGSPARRVYQTPWIVARIEAANAARRAAAAAEEEEAGVVRTPKRAGTGAGGAGSVAGESPDLPDYETPVLPGRGGTGGGEGGGVGDEDDADDEYIDLFLDDM